MLFNSWHFLAFVLVVLALDAALYRQTRARRMLLLAASYYFYAQWNWQYLGLIAFTTILDFNVGQRLRDSGRPGRWLALSLTLNLGILATFKYADFLIRSANAGFVLVEPSWHWSTLDLLLPIGISFYTFQSISYTVDLYRGQLTPRRNLLDYALFLSFFPHLVAGPIVRASEFFHELDLERRCSAREGQLAIALIVLGLLKKMVGADSLAEFVDPVFAAPQLATPLQAWLAMYAYAFQIYFDFSGYTDVAIGLAALFGIRFPQNFNYPYLATSVQEFWRRWHMTLSRWLRDYLYISLGGSRGSAARTLLNLFITMLLGGLWHGASWNFVLWGALHGAYLALERVAMQVFPAFYASQNRIVLLLRWLLVVHLVCFAWLLFRSTDLTLCAAYLMRMAELFTLGALADSDTHAMGGLLAVLMFLHWRIGRTQLHEGLADAGPLRYATVIGSALLAIILLSPSSVVPFIYFRF
jgi:alginate O-acetyltransferase complex protein AlgI